MPNLRNTMDRIESAYAKIKTGDFTYLRCTGEIRSNDKGLSEFSPHWMDDLPTDKVKQCWDYYSIAKSYASIISNTYPTYWNIDELVIDYPEADIFHEINLVLPDSYPIYRINPEIIVKSNENVGKTGIYICEEDRNRIEFMAASEEEGRGVGSVIATGMDPETFETFYGDCTWVLVERIADEGGSSETMQVENLKGFSGQSCPQSGYWWSPANQLQSRYFEQGEVFPEFENNSWGETIWYLEVTNKK